MIPRRDNFCGPAGDGLISESLSFLIDWGLKKLNIELNDECEGHDVDWDNGPSFRDDLLFALRVYDSVKRQKNATWALFIMSVGFVMVRGTAFAYKANTSLDKLKTKIKEK